MDDNDFLIGSVMEDAWLTLEQIAAACTADPEWLAQRLGEGCFPDAESVAGVWRFSTSSILRARRMRQFERDFDAAPELAALIADLLEETDSLRARLRRAGVDNT
ncbi:MAG: transcriptional regulatory protein MerR family [Proteobacteria bacterium]|nr:transcriptional regulatory protein MerR family [Pseudomonadota bacterium]